jgi:hypothetical protein
LFGGGGPGTFTGSICCEGEKLTEPNEKLRKMRKNKFSHFFMMSLPPIEA